MSNSEERTVRTFTGASLREALAQVRSELGPDALIMGQQQMGHLVALQACLEMPLASSESLESSVSLPASEPVPESAAPVEEPAVEKEFADILLEQRDATTVDEDVVVSEQGAAVAQQARLVETFRHAGYDPEVIADIPGCTNLQELRRTVTQRLNYAHKPIAGLSGCYRFVGASGVGKSATLIKVLVEWVLRNGAHNVVVVSTDNERLAGTESLQLTCQMLSVPMCECSPAELPDELTRLSSKALVLVDSPALELRQRYIPIAGLRDIWVCSALHGSANLTAQFNTVAALRPAGVVVTQLDQQAAPDGIASLLYQWRIPLYWLGISAHLPEGIDLADEETLYHNLFGGDQPVALKLAV